MAQAARQGLSGWLLSALVATSKTAPAHGGRVCKLHDACTTKQSGSPNYILLHAMVHVHAEDGITGREISSAPLFGLLQLLQSARERKADSQQSYVPPWTPESVGLEPTKTSHHLITIYNSST